jgi:hypothetical protein
MQTPAVALCMLPGMRHQLGAFAVLSLLVVGCGDGGSSSGDDTPIDAPGGGSPDAAIPPGYTKLISRTWTMPAGQADTYKCIRATVPTDTYVTNIRAQAPAGTHHTVLSISAGNVAGADGEYDCSVGAIGRPMLYASGVGTDDLAFPQNVGLKIAAGTQVHLNLHLFNATDQVLNGDSGILIKTVPTAPPMLAEMVFAGKIAFAVDPGVHDVIGGCTVQTPYQMFAYWPHMHKSAVHSKLELTHSGTTTVLHDKAYDFNEQVYYKPTAEISVAQGDQIRVTCTYDNKTGARITFGDSSNEEMCFTGLYRYPSQNASITQCTDVPGGIP